MKNVYKYSSWARLAVSTWHAWCALLRMEKLSGLADYSVCSDRDGDGKLEFNKLTTFKKFLKKM